MLYKSKITRGSIQHLYTLVPQEFNPESKGGLAIKHGANLTGKDISKMNINGENLSGANLFNADLEQTDLRRVNLRGAKFK